MARNEWEDAIQAVLTGGLQGYQAGRAGQQDLEKMLVMEHLKNKMKQDFEASQLEKLGITSGGPSISQPSGVLAAVPSTPQAGLIAPPRWKQIVKGGVTYVNPEQGLYEQQVSGQKLKQRKDIVEKTNLAKQIMKTESEIGQINADFKPILKDVDRVLGYWKEIPAFQKGPWDRLLPGRGAGAVSLRAGGRDIFKKDGDWYAKTGLKEGYVPRKLTVEEMARISPEEFALGKTAAPTTTYIQTKDAIMGNIAKKFAGEVGVLTEQDIKRIGAMWPTQSDDDATSYRKIAGIKEFITSRVISKQKEKQALISMWKKRGMSTIPFNPQELGPEEVTQSQDDTLVNQLLDQLGAD